MNKQEIINELEKSKEKELNWLEKDAYCKAVDYAIKLIQSLTQEVSPNAEEQSNAEAKKARKYRSPMLDELDKEIEKDNAEAMKEHAIKFARYYISNKSIIEFNKDNDEEVYNEYINTLTTK